MWRFEREALPEKFTREDRLKIRVVVAAL